MILNGALTLLAIGLVVGIGLAATAYVVVGGLSLATSFVHSLPLEFLLSSALLVGAKMPDEFRKQYKELNATFKKLMRSPVGIMFGRLRDKVGFS